jgi:hypothetical protein
MEMEQLLLQMGGSCVAQSTCNIGATPAYNIELGRDAKSRKVLKWTAIQEFLFGCTCIGR